MRRGGEEKVKRGEIEEGGKKKYICIFLNISCRKEFRGRWTLDDYEGVFFDVEDCHEITTSDLF
jgi:hypothetical protein